MQSPTRIRCALALCLVATAATAQPNSDALTFRQTLFSLFIDGPGFGPMESPIATAASPDGNDVYVSARLSGSIVHFERNAATGALEFISAVPVSLDNQPAAVSPFGIALSPDGRFLYTAARDFGTFGGIARFDRNLRTGTLTPGASLPDDGTVIAGIHSPIYIALAPDGRHLYVLSNPQTISPFNAAALAVVSTDPATGAMAFVESFPLSNSLPPIPGGGDFSGTIADLTVSPDGKNVYVARAFNESLDAYSRDDATGRLTFVGATYLRAAPRGFVQSVAISPDGLNVYACEGLGGFVYVLDRAADGTLSISAGADVPLIGARDVLVSPDGARVYAVGQGFYDGDIAQLNAYGRNPLNGDLSLLENIFDRITGFDVFDSPGRATVSPDSAHVYLPGLTNSSLTVFSVERPELPCEDFPEINDEYAALAKAFDLYEDLNYDGLPESAALALLEEASCANTDDAFDEAITNAYLFDLASVTNELGLDQDDWAPYRHVVAALISTSTSMRTYLNEAADPFGIELQTYYVSVTCTDSACEPANTRGNASDEPLAGAGDPDQDGFTNSEEWANVLARGGSEREFAVSALDPTNDGTRAISFSSSGNGGACFIATAAFGTPLAAELDSLRAIRDRDLLTNPLGAALTDFYYRLSPPAADVIAAHPAYRRAARWLVACTITQAWLPIIAGAFALVVTRSIRRRSR